MYVLGIETTCDETACSIVKGGREILSHVVSSQADLHRLYGGVYPELAARRHLDLILPVLSETLMLAEMKPSRIDLFAVARGPGLIGPLLIGLNTAKALSLGWKRPFIGVNHVEAHLYAALMEQEKPLFPALGLVLSGGHSLLLKITEIGCYELIGTTVDDAVGEAFDKVGSLLGLPYPGGPAIEALAQRGDPKRYPFKIGRVKGRPWDLSFSGMKTGVLYAVKGPNSNKDSPLLISEDEKAHVAAGFQESALSGIVEKACRAARHFQCRALYVGGGVSSNLRLRELLTRSIAPLPLFFPPKGLSVDNGAMIAGLGYAVFQREGPSPLSLEPLTRMPFRQKDDFRK